MFQTWKKNYKSITLTPIIITMVRMGLRNLTPVATHFSDIPEHTKN